jgi:hypothetical protein
MKSAPKDHTANNQDAARIILASPDRYGAGMCAWARKVLGMPIEAALSAPPPAIISQKSILGDFVLDIKPALPQTER